MNRNNLLFIIDMQNDFCLPEGKLAVAGAMADVERLAAFIERKGEEIDEIVLTQDSHQPFSIAHPSFWLDASGEHPLPFSLITPDDLSVGNYRAANPAWQSWCVTYIARLNEQREYPHVIWPEHCLAGSVGEAIVEPLMTTIEAWGRSGKGYTIIRKGESPLVEQFGALRANIEIASDNRTQLNQTLVGQLKKATTIYLAGEARSHCVASTLKQLLTIEGLAEKVILLNDCMSDVTGFEGVSDPIFDAARMAGATITQSTQL